MEAVAVIAVLEKILELVVNLVGKDTVQGLLSDDAVKRANAVADAAQALKLSGKQASVSPVSLAP